MRNLTHGHKPITLWAIRHLWVVPRAEKSEEAHLLTNEAFGLGYTNALRQAYPMISASSDYVMYWWYRAAKLAQEGKTKRFGFITTSTINQLQNRCSTIMVWCDGAVLGERQAAVHCIRRALATLSHTGHIGGTVWGDGGTNSGAKVRIAMTVAEAGIRDGVLATVMTRLFEDGRVQLTEERGKIHANLTIGVDVSKAKSIEANENMAFTGIIMNGSGFIVTQEEARELGLETVPGLERHIRPYRNGRDIMGVSRDAMVIDMYGLSREDVERRFPLVYQWLFEKVRPQRPNICDDKRSGRLRDECWLFDRQAVTSACGA